MAAAIPTKSATLEGQLFESANRIQAAELALPAENRPNNVQITLDPEGGNLTIVFTCSADFNNNESGELVVKPTPYLP